MIGLACEHVNPSMSCCAKTVSSTTIAAYVLLTVRKQLSSSKKVYCLPTNQSPHAQVHTNALSFLSSKVQPEIACRGVAR